MKRLLAIVVAGCLLLAAASLIGGQKPVGLVFRDGELRIEVHERNPWTHLRLSNTPEVFHFAIIGDRTGGQRTRVFARAVAQLNLMQPAFVLSVGDLIEGYTDDEAELTREWSEFEQRVRGLQMPFFYVPGNHDVSSVFQEHHWRDRFGRRYYHFVYRNVLF